MWLVAFDLALLVLGTLRLSRLVTTDSLGQWWIYKPVYRKASGRWTKYVEGLTCPFCVGFWIGALALVPLAAVGGPGAEVDDWRAVVQMGWRWGMAAFALNYVVGHVSKRLD